MHSILLFFEVFSNTPTSQSSLFYTGEEHGGFEAKKFCRPTGVVEIAAGLFQPQFNILPFAELHALFDEDFLSCVDSS